MDKSQPILDGVLARRHAQGKEHGERMSERRGQASRARPEGPLCWVHAASVGEAQSALILIHQLLKQTKNLHVLVTTGTLSSASMMERSLPAQAFHQFYPLDHPQWTAQFLDHWKPDFVLWMESELWPNMLGQIRERKIPALLINARLSAASFRKWSLLRGLSSMMLGAFEGVLCQTQNDALYFKKLGARHVSVTDNLKFSAKALPFDEAQLKAMIAARRSRPCWVFASSHKGEETMAARVHDILKRRIPELLTIIVPRHPDRRADIREELATTGLNIQFRGEQKSLPGEDADIYVADTFGELGLFYRAAPIAFIGRSFSDDGGGGHNPIEAAQLGCAVMHGPNVQNLQDIFDDMDGSGAAMLCRDEGSLVSMLNDLLSNPALLEQRQAAAVNFARKKERVIENVMPHIQNILERLPMLEMAR